MRTCTYRNYNEDNTVIPECMKVTMRIEEKRRETSLIAANSDKVMAVTIHWNKLGHLFIWYINKLSIYLYMYVSWYL